MNVKQGDLAITTNAFHEENIGRIVRVVRPYSGPQVIDRFRWTVPADWVVEVVGSPMTHVIAGEVKSGPFPDAWLRPISGIPDTETTDTEQPIQIAEVA